MQYLVIHETKGNNTDAEKWAGLIFLTYETFEKRSILFKVRESEDFNRRNT